MEKFANRALERYNLKLVGKEMPKRAFIRRYREGIFRCIDECYKELYGTVPFTKEMIDQVVSQFMILLNMEYIFAAVNENAEVVAFGFCLPGIGEAVQKSGGRLTPACLIRLLKAVRKPKSIDLGLVGILPQYRKSGLSALIMTILQGMLSKDNVEYLETNLNLEDNIHIQANWKHFDHIQHKRRRSYKKEI